MVEPLPTIIFVDDEVQVLDGLRRSLRKHRDIWNMVYLEGGQAALDFMRSNPVDAVVSDMRMPVVDGASVMAEAAHRHPQSVRIILSGHAEQEMLMRAIGSAHQFLPKPCDPERLTDVLHRLLNLQCNLDSESLRHLADSLRSLPSPSKTFVALMAEIDSPTSSAASVGKIVETDLGLTAQILRLSNSPCFSMPSRISSCKQAVQLLGLETVKALATLAEFHKIADRKPELQNVVARLAERSLSIGTAAARIARLEKLPIETVEAASTAGILCHVGTLVLQVNDSKTFNAAMEDVEKGRFAVPDAETNRFGASHAQLGGRLVALWDFPSEIVEAVCFHHTPSGTLAPDSKRTVDVLACVHAAQFLVRTLNKPDMDREEMIKRGLDAEYLAAAGCLDRIEAWRDAVVVALKDLQEGVA
ncbi:HDOD domain-containing protein [Hwanghaeella sp.]|uniref:HDOD domain-containing protein n=1 Tax=Hwanghaeella sp. TaxID=2605943 RepID=UPI003CCC138C